MRPLGPEGAAPSRRSLLHIGFDGPRDGTPWLVLHHRYGDLTDARALGARVLGDQALRIAVRSARTQTRGSLAPPKGSFWFIGPPDRPELSTLGDALYQLDLLLEDLREVDGIDRLNLLGHGEGAVVGLLLALVRPDRIASVVAIDPAFPANFDRMPLAVGDTHGLRIELRGPAADCAGISARLAGVAPGAAVTAMPLAPAG
ncbi:MAG: hypothetical protein QM682_14910 [Paracoccus sp. (in: a-proteobacteria)]|uniref:hypothetical protein n=1 Tax=Paracoccus sp. TaxID=267 RepID=UPI0039E4A041